MLESENSRLTLRTLWLFVVITFLIKLYLTYLLPMTADEAYEIWIWGQHLAGSYYDHPLMSGWYGHFMLLFADNRVWLRLPQIIGTSAISFLIYGLFGTEDRQKALSAAILFAVSPVNLLFVLIISDSLLLFFTMAMIAFLLLAFRHKHWMYYFLAGASLACAFWSKYLIAPTALGVFLFFIFAKKLPWRFLKGLIIFGLLSLAIAQNLWWNYTHAWTNILFNVFNRNQGAAFNIGNVVAYLVCVIFLFTPMLFWQLAKQQRTIFKFVTGNLTQQLLFWSGIFPLIFYFVLSLKKQIGLHWFISNYTIVFMAIIFILSTSTLKKQIKAVAIYTGVLVTICIIVLNLPVSILKANKKYDNLNYEVNLAKIIPQFKPLLANFIVMTPSYALSALYSMYLNHYTPVWGHGGVHSRQDDIATDFHQFSGKNIIISLGCLASRPSLAQYRRYFQRVSLVDYQFNGSSCYYVKGINFKFAPYRAQILRGIYQEYYHRPKILPRGKNFYAQKYGFALQ